MPSKKQAPKPEKDAPRSAEGFDDVLRRMLETAPKPKPTKAVPERGRGKAKR